MGKTDCLNPNAYPELVKLHEELNRDASSIEVRYTPKGKRSQTFKVEGDHIFNSDGKEVYKTDSESRRAILSSVEEKTPNRTSVKYYTGDIIPEANTIFVFGSNPEGRHGAGAAKVAREKFGAIYGQGEGLQGNAYALPTEDLKKGLRSIPEYQIIENIERLYETARQNPDKQFKVAYRNTDTESLSGYTGLEMIFMFLAAGSIPTNIVFSKEWVDTGKFNLSTEQNEKVSMEEIADYVREFSAKKHIDQNKWTEYKEEALNYVKEKANGNTPDVTPIPQEKPNLLEASEEMINSLQNELKTAFNDKQHEYTLTLSDGSKIKVRHSVTEIARNYSRGVDILTPNKPVTPNIGMVMGNVFDAAIKGAFEFGSVPKLVNLDERSRKAIQQYYDALKESLDMVYGEGKWKAYTMNLSISGAYKYGENRFVLAGTPDIIIASENEWLILDAKTTSHELDPVTMQQYSMQTSWYKRLFEDRFSVLKGKVKTGLMVAETNYPKVKNFNFDKEGNLYFGPVSKNYRWDNPTNIEEGVYGFFIKADVNSDLFKSLLKATDYIDMKELESISEEELRKAGLSREDFILDTDDTEGITSAESIIDTDTFLRPVTKKELNDFSRNIMNLYSYYINRLHDENLRKDLGIIDEALKNPDGEYMSLYELKRSRVIYNSILNYIKNQYLFLEYLKAPKNSEISNKYRWLIKNWNLVIQNGNAQLIKNEGISVSLEESKDTTDVSEEILNANNLEEIEESQKDSYNISALEVPITASMSTVLKSMLSTIPIRQWNKKTVNEKPVYEPVAFVYDEWGLPKFYTQEEVVLILINDLAGSVDESDMRNRMEKLAEREPYVRNVIELLDENPDVWPLFYTTFNLMPMEYTEVYRSYDNTTKSKHPMSRKLQDRSVYNKLMSKLKTDIRGNKIPLLKVQIGGFIEADRDAVKSLLQSYEKLLSGSTDIIKNKGVRKAEWRASALKALGITDPKIIAVSADYERLIVSALKELRDRRDGFISIEKVSPLYVLYHNIFLEMQLNANKYSSLSVFSKGKNYQRFVAPNYVGMILNRMTDEKHFSDEQIKKYIEDTFMWNSLYGYKKNDGKWVFYNPFLEALYNNTQKIRTSIEHSLETSAFGRKYSDLSDRNYFTSLLSEYYSFSNDSYKVQYCRIPLPVLSDKPASEFISMPRFIFGNNTERVKSRIIENSIGYLYLDVKRIASTIAMLKNKAAEVSSYSIKRTSVPKQTLTKINKGEDLTFSDFVDSEGNLKEWAASSAASFKQLAFLNEELENRTQFGQYLLDLINGKTVDQSVFIDMFKNAYKADMEQAKQDLISYLGEINYSDSNLKYDLGLNYETEDNDLNRIFEEFLWNYVYNERNLVNLLIGDPSFYPDTVMLVKRFAQVHSFTNRPDIEATFSTPEGERIRFSDGTQRVVYISDKKIKSEMADALKALFEKKAKEAENARNTNEMNNYKMLAEKANAFRNINITDGQAFSSPTGFFKKYGMLGMLTPEQKELYWKIKNGTYTAEDLSEGFGVIKPFTYTTMRYNTGTEAMPEIGIPTQIKDSEYMLAFAGLLLKEEPGMEYLKALYQLMEDSAYTNGKYNGKGIDTILFLSTVKSGETEVIDLEKMEKAKNPLKYLKSQIYDSEGNYTSKVHSFPFSDWGKQQSVPNDLMDAKHAMGSQFRVLNPAELPDNIDITVNDKTYKDKGEFIRDYFTYIANIMQDGYNKMEKLFKLNENSVKAQNKAASDIVKQSILKDARYSSELLWAVSLTDGYFNLPLGDNSQTSTIPGMLFSRIKSAINKVPFPGGPVVQVTGYGRDLHIMLRDKNGKKLMGFQEYLDANGLEEDTQSIAEWNKYLVDNDFSIDHFEMEVTCPTEEIERKILNGEKLTEDELEILTYRIPTENKYSMFHGRVKKYLPRTSGDVIMLPYEITLISGLDFDVDKLYTIFKYIGENLTEIEKTKNKIFEMQYAILQQGFAMADSMNPGEFDSLEQLADLRSPEKLEATNIIYPDKQMIFRKMNMSGKKLVAFAANARVSHAICEMLNMKIKVPDFTVDGIKISSLDKESSGLISIGDIYSKFNGRKIARILSEILSAAVDNGKNPVLARIGITPATFNIASTLLRIGVPIEFVSALLLHPKVIQMAADAENSGVNIEDIIDREFKAYAKELNMSSKDYLKFTQGINFTTEDFVTSIRSDNPLIKNETVVGFLYNLIPAISNMKRVMFWTRLNSTSNAVNADIYRDLVYEMQLNDFYSQTDDIENIDPQISLSKEQLFTYMPYLKVLSNVYTELLPQLCGNLFPQYSKDFRNLLYTLIDTLGIPYEKLNSRLLKRIFNQYQVFLATKDLIDGSERGRGELMYGLPKNLVNISTNIKNYFLENLLVVDKGDGRIPEIYAEKIATKEDLDELIASWETLTLYENKEHPNTQRAVNNLSEKLISYAIMKTGMAWHPRGFLHLAPNKAKMRYGNNSGYRRLTDPNSDLWSSSRNNTETPLMFLNFIRMFARNNPDVLTVPMSYIEAVAENAFLSSRPDVSIRGEEVSVKRSFYDRNIPGTITITDGDSIWVINSVSDNYVTYKKTKPLSSNFMEYDYHEDAFSMASIESYDINEDSIKMDEDIDSEYYENSVSSSDYSPELVYNVVTALLGKEISDKWREGNEEVIRDTKEEVLEALKNIKNPTEIEVFVEEKIKELCQ